MRFELWEYECSLLKNKTKKLFESDNSVEIINWVDKYFKEQNYFNCVYLRDNYVNKNDYVGYIGRERTIDVWDYSGNISKTITWKEFVKRTGGK